MVLSHEVVHVVWAEVDRQEATCSREPVTGSVLIRMYFFFIVYHFGFLIHFVGLSELFNSCNLCFQGLWQSEFCLENGV